MATFFIADHHFGHRNILLYERTEFETIEQHDRHIIDEHNKIIKPTDIVYFLGDIGFGSMEHLKECLSQMKGRKILILGNHDHLSPSLYLSLGFEKAINHPIYWEEGDGKVILSHTPVKEALENPFVINIHGHLHGMNLKLSNYFNVSAKNIDYKPQNSKKFISSYQQCTKRKEAFLEEWYAPFYEVIGYREDLVVNSDNSINIEASIAKRNER